MKNTITIDEDGWVSLETKNEGVVVREEGFGDVGVDVEIIDLRK